MARPYSSAVIPAAIDQVWPLVRDFAGLHQWHPAIGNGELTSGASTAEVGAVRRLTLAGDGGIVVEQLVAIDDRFHSLTYEILESPFPVRSYISTVRLAPITATGQTFAEWWTEFDCEAADAESLTDLFANGVFGAGLAALVDRFAS